MAILATLSRWGCSLVILVSVVAMTNVSANNVRRSERSYISGGVLLPADSIERKRGIEALLTDSLRLDSLRLDSLRLDSLHLDSMAVIDMAERISSGVTKNDPVESAAMTLLNNAQVMRGGAPTPPKEDIKKRPFISDSMSLSKMCWLSTVLPGFGQIYNKQYWKVPILYSTVTAGTLLYINETKRYRPLKEEFDDLLTASLYRNDEINEVQANMIRSNTRRQFYLGATIASYIYFLGDAAMNYSTNSVSHIKRATTLSTIFPGAGQIYNKQYWKVPFVVGGFAAFIYTIDWNNRGYQRFSRAYTLIIDYENHPDDYPNGSADEFGGRYSADYMKRLRDSYRRNRDLCIIMTAGLYILQIIDAHVDAHFQDFDISDELTMNIEPAVGYSYSYSKGSDVATYGFNIGLKF